MHSFDPIIVNITLGLIILAIGSALTGVFAYMKNDSLSADAIAHSTLPGVCIGFIVAGEKSTIYMYLGALLTGILCQLLISMVQSNSKIKKDAITAIVLTTLFALGLVLSKYILESPDYTNKSGLTNFLFGQAASIQKADLWFMGITTVLIVALIYFFGRALKTLAFDPTQFEIYGWSKPLVQLFFNITLTLTVIIGIRAVGVILMSALIITPAIIARSLSNKFGIIIAIAILVNIFSALLGTYLSFLYENPTGPWVIVVLSLIAFASISIGNKFLKTSR